MATNSAKRIDVDQPLWSQETFYGRFRHFAWKTNPANIFHSTGDLTEAKNLVQQYRAGLEPPGTTEEQIKRAMRLHSASFHPGTGELQFVLFRMCCNVPACMVINGAMLHFYRSGGQVFFWQWLNQSGNAMVNYSNRSGSTAEPSLAQLGVAYASATACALTAALGLKGVLERRAKQAAPVALRLVPFIAVGTAHCVNVPLMRQNELLEGVDLRDDRGSLVDCKSTYAARKGIGQVVLSRNVIMAPAMLVLPLIMQRLERTAWLAARTYLHGPIQVLGVGLFFAIMTPVGCAIFPQVCSITSEELRQKDAKAFKVVEEKFVGQGLAVPEKFFFNKGL